MGLLLTKIPLISIILSPIDKGYYCNFIFIEIFLLLPRKWDKDLLVVGYRLCYARGEGHIEKNIMYKVYYTSISSHYQIIMPNFAPINFGMRLTLIRQSGSNASVKK